MFYLVIFLLHSTTWNYQVCLYTYLFIISFLDYKAGTLSVLFIAVSRSDKIFNQELGPGIR